MSNLLEQASLVLIPSGYKEDIVYSEIPIDGNGDLSFTRASNGTRINSAGLVEVTPWNLQTFSEDFTNAKYTTAASSVSANVTTAPNGTTTADKIVENSANDQHYIFFSSQQTAYNQTRISVYAKSAGRTKLLMWESAITNADSLFDLSTGVVISSNSGNAANLSTTVGQIEDAGNGWFRCSFNYSTSSGGGTIRLQLYTNATSYTGDGTSGIFIWGLQENIGSTAKPYFPTTDRLNVPRLTYQNGGGGCPSLLLEKQSTNLNTYSEQFDNANWTKEDITVTANATTSPDGTQNADKLVPNTSNIDHSIYQTTTSSVVRTFSVYAKADGYNYLFLGSNNNTATDGVFFNLSNGTISQNTSTLTASIESVGNGWYRCIASQASWPTIYAIICISQNGTSFNFAGNGTDGISVWGAQLEASSYQTSYISTTTSSATRVADACFKTGISSLIGQTEGVLFLDAKITALPTDGSLFGVQKTASNFVIRFGSQGSNIYAQCYNGSTNLFFETVSYTLGTRIKLGFAYKAGSYAFYVNGIQIATGTNATTIPACDELMTNSLWGNTNPSLYEVNEVILFPSRLTNAELASLTTI